METIKDILRRRQIEDDRIFFVERAIVSEAGEYSVMQRRNWKGICCHGETLLPTIYDDVAIIDETTAVVTVNGQRAAYHLSRRSLLTDYEYEEIAKVPYYNYLYLLRDSKRGVYDLSASSLILSPEYVEISNDFSSQYLWVKRNRYYHFVNLQTGKFCSMPNLILAYDSPDGMFGLCENGKVSYFTENGTSDYDKFRTIVIRHGGHLTLQNFNDRLTHIVDIYGNVLNT